MSEKIILLVEDNEDDAELTRVALQENSFSNELVVARDGAEALDLLLGPGRIAPHLVLLDLKLPKLDGFDVLRWLRADERTKLLPIVVLTSSLEDEDLLSSYSLGANSYVRKPVDFAQFIEAVNHLSRYWLALNQPPPELRAQ